MTPDEAKEIVCLAKCARIGLLINSTDPERARAMLYNAAKKLGVDGLSIRRWPTDEANLAIVRRNAKIKQSITEPNDATD